MLDGFQAERDQAITLDTTRVRLRTPHREFVVIDAPGHKELLKNMIGGASAAAAALLVLDAQAGSEEQTLRHAYLLKLLGVRSLLVAINKMDLVGYEESAFATRAREVTAALSRIGIEPAAIVPVSARDGANLRERGAMPGWYRGPSLVAALEALPAATPERALPLRMPVQDVYRHGERRVLAGRLEFRARGGRRRTGVFAVGPHRQGRGAAGLAGTGAGCRRGRAKTLASCWTGRWSSNAATWRVIVSMRRS